MRSIERGIASLILAGATALAGPATAQPAPDAQMAQPAPDAPPVPVAPPPPYPQPAPAALPVPEAPAAAPAPPVQMAPAVPAPSATFAAPAPPRSPAPAAPYRRCVGVGRGSASTMPCALRATDGQPPTLLVRIERNLPTRPARLLLIWSEREGLGGELLRLTPPSFADASTAAGTVFTVPIPIRFCRPNARRFTVELELADGRNVGPIGEFSFPCTP